jgi:hypothetical protein
MTENRRTREFKDFFRNLPPGVKSVSKETFNLFLRDPKHYSLQLHEYKGLRLTPLPVATKRPKVFGVYVTRGFRALALYRPDIDTNVWFWTGKHSDCDTKFKPGTTLPLPVK